jgi:hypothetical protein
VRSGGTCGVCGSSGHPISCPVTCREQRVLETLRYLFLIKHFFFVCCGPKKKKKNQSKVNFKQIKALANQKTIEETTSHKW